MPQERNSKYCAYFKNKARVNEKSIFRLTFILLDLIRIKSYSKDNSLQNLWGPTFTIISFQLGPSLTLFTDIPLLVQLSGQQMQDLSHLVTMCQPVKTDTRAWVSCPLPPWPTSHCFPLILSSEKVFRATDSLLSRDSSVQRLQRAELEKKTTTLIMIVNNIYLSWRDIYETLLLGWPKSLFSFFCTTVWKNPNKPFGKPNILLLLLEYNCFTMLY